MTEIVNRVEQLRSCYPTVSGKCAQPGFDLCDTFTCSESKHYRAVLMANQLDTWNCLKIRKRFSRSKHNLKK